MNRWKQASILVTIAMATAWAGDLLAQETAPSVAESALNSIFNPRRAPAKKSMGLLQRSFLDLVETSETKLQLAIVLDGTESMKRELSGVRRALKNLVTDLRRYKGEKNVSVALVVYRDVGARSGQVTVPLPKFTADIGQLQQAIEGIKPESGAPYFPELIDVGIHEALRKLPWSDDQETMRWLLVVGDAPPFDPGFSDPKKKARRQIGTDRLIELARQRKVKINCLLCASDREHAAIQKRVMAKAERFMGELASGTGGLMLNLADAGVIKSLAVAEKKPRVKHRRIARITADDVRQASRAAAQLANRPMLSIAVLPHVPVSQMKFDAADPAEQVAAELREKLRNILPHVKVIQNKLDMKRAVRFAKLQRGLTEQQRSQAVGNRLNATYVVRGSLIRDNNGALSLSTEMIRVRDGVLLGTAKETAPSWTLVGTGTANNPAKGLVGNVANHMLKTTLIGLRKNNLDPSLKIVLESYGAAPAMQREMVAPISAKDDARAAILEGLQAMENSLVYTAGDARLLDELTRIRKILLIAVEADPRNPFAHMLLANCYLNHSYVFRNNGDPARRKTALEHFEKHLTRAQRSIDRVRHTNARREILADYAFHVEKDVPRAALLYEQLADGRQTKALHSVRRAHWMLAGIYSGDWNVDKKYVDATKAREHLIQILARWPDSPEGKFISAHLRWDDYEGTQHPLLPLENTNE
jgi:TolB-like protein